MNPSFAIDESRGFVGLVRVDGLPEVLSDEINLKLRDCASVALLQQYELLLEKECESCDEFGRHVFGNKIAFFVPYEGQEECIAMIHACQQFHQMMMNLHFRVSGRIAHGSVWSEDCGLLGGAVLEAQQSLRNDDEGAILLCNSVCEWNGQQGKTEDGQADILGILLEEGWLVAVRRPGQNRASSALLAVALPAGLS